MKSFTLRLQFLKLIVDYFSLILKSNKCQNILFQLPAVAAAVEPVTKHHRTTHCIHLKDTATLKIYE